MYRTCIHCQQPLGSNDSIEALPIGRRVAFDAARGRLWVVCRNCERWNLTPFDARYEAIEQCERMYRDTQVRLSTDNIGLARLKDGTDLVRIGRPMRPEFAAWRYGDQFGRRRKQMIVNSTLAGGAVAGGLAAYSGLASTGVFVGASALLGTLTMAINFGISATVLVQQRQALKHAMRLPDGRLINPTGTLRLIELDVPEKWGLETTVWVPSPGLSGDASSALSEQYELGYISVRGAHALPLLRRFMPRINKGGATPNHVRDGVSLIESAGGPERFGEWAVTQRRKWAAQQQQGDSGSLNYIPVAARLAFEMAINEDAERRALEGELAQLEAAWKEAEELASISDHLTPIQSVERKLETLRTRRR